MKNIWPLIALLCAIAIGWWTLGKQDQAIDPAPEQPAQEATEESTGDGFQP